MTSTTLAPAERSERVRELPRAVPILLAGAGFGLLAQLLFFGAGLGINYPIALAALLAAGWLVPAREARDPRPWDLWLPVAALILAGFVALRGDTTLVTLDVLGSLLLAGASVASFGGLAIVERPIGGLLLLGARVAGSAAGAALDALATGRHGLHAERLSGGLGRAAPVVRGLLIAIPLLVVFAALFSSADAVFAQVAGDLLDLDLGSLPGRTVMALVAAWLAVGLLVFVARGEESAADGRLDGAWARRPRLGAVEAVTVLLALDLLFAAFVALQATYLFGGRDTLDAAGLTYAEYARRGFFELLAVAVAVGGLVLALEGFVARRSRTYVAASVGLVLMTLVVLASAFLRLRLYQDAYGWTELRFYVLAAIGWLALGATGAVVALVTDRTRWLIHLMLGLSVAFGLAFNVIGPVRFIAEQNVARAADPALVPPGGHTGLDIWYLASLGDDAVAVIARAVPSRIPADLLEEAEILLENRRLGMTLDQGGRAWQAWNLSRERARSLLSR